MRLHVGSHQYDLCLPSGAANPDSIHISVHNVCRSASDINHIGAQRIRSRNYESSNRKKAHKIQFESDRLRHVLVWIQVYSHYCYYGKCASFDYQRSCQEVNSKSFLNLSLFRLLGFGILHVYVSSGR